METCKASCTKELLKKYQPESIEFLNKSLCGADLVFATPVLTTPQPTDSPTPKPTRRPTAAFQAQGSITWILADPVETCTDAVLEQIAPIDDTFDATCGGRIEYLQRVGKDGEENTGDELSELEACQEVAAIEEGLACGACAAAIERSQRQGLQGQTAFPQQ